MYMSSILYDTLLPVFPIQFSDSREQLLRLLAHYLQALGKKLLHYATEIKVKCANLYAVLVVSYNGCSVIWG